MPVVALILGIFSLIAAPVLFVALFGLYAIGVVDDLGAGRLLSGAIFLAIVGPVLIALSLIGDS